MVLKVGAGSLRIQSSERLLEMYHFSLDLIFFKAENKHLYVFHVCFKIVSSGLVCGLNCVSSGVLM